MNALLTLFVLAAAASQPKLAWFGLHAPGASAEESQAIALLDDLVQSELAATDVYSVIGKKDLETMLGVERQRQLLGCSDEGSSCMNELAGALAAERLVTGSLVHSAETWALTLSMLDGRKSSVLRRVTRTIEGQSPAPLSDEVQAMVYELVNADPVRATEKPLTAERGFGGLMVGIKAEADALGFGPDLPIAPAVTVEYSGKWLGGALTLLPKAIPGVRLEGRFYAVHAKRVRVHVALGATAFTTAVGLRAGAGAAFRIGHFQVLLDAGYERFFSLQRGNLENAVVVGLGVGWAF